MHNLEICPICKKKKLVGNHKKACQGKHVLLWIKYEKLLVDISSASTSRSDKLLFSQE